MHLIWNKLNLIKWKNILKNKLVKDNKTYSCFILSIWFTLLNLKKATAIHYHDFLVVYYFVLIIPTFKWMPKFFYQVI